MKGIEENEFWMRKLIFLINLKILQGIEEKK